MRGLKGLGVRALQPGFWELTIKRHRDLSLLPQNKRTLVGPRV